MIQFLRRKFESDAKGEAAFPLMVLSALYFFDEFDTSAFATLAPEIQKHFHLSDERFIQLIIINVSVTVLLAVPLGYWADRVSRKKIVVASGILAGSFSLFTGLTGLGVSVGLLTLARFGNGVGLLANGPIHNSLLSDYYTPNARPTVFANHANAVYLAAVLGPAFAGLVGWLIGWQAAFFLLFIPIIITTVIATRLHDPVRGATDPGGGISQTALPPKFWPATRTLWRIKTLRRTFIAAIFIGAGIIPLVAYLALFYEREYNLGPGARGAIGAFTAIFTFLGVQKGGEATPKWFAKSMGLPIVRVGQVLSLVGVGLLLIAAVPYLWLAIALSVVTNYILGFFLAPLAAVQALVSPARERSLAFSLGAIFLVFGVVVFFALGLGKIADEHGLRWAIAALAPWWIIGGMIGSSSGKFVEGDVQRAMILSAAEADAAKARYDAEAELTIAPGFEPDFPAVVTEVRPTRASKRAAPAKRAAPKPAAKRAPAKKKSVTPQALGKKTAASAKSAATRPPAKKNGAGR